MKKMNKKKGFTLMEMLIVVAIIAILIAIAIPAFSEQLKKAKQSADNANVRSAYAEAMANYLTTNATSSKAAFTSDKKAQAEGNGETISGVIKANWAKGDDIVVWVGGEGKAAITTKAGADAPSFK